VTILPKTNGNRRIFFLLTIVVFLWGVNAVSIKYLISFFPPLALAPIRLCLASGLLLPIVFRQYGYKKLSYAEWRPIVVISTFCIFLHQIALSLGLKATSGMHAVLILGLNPLFTVTFAGYLLKESFTWTKGLAILLGFSGLLLVVSGNSQGGATLAGDGVMLIATITFVIGSLFVKKATVSVSPLIVTAYSHALASIGLLLLGLFINPVWSYAGSFGFWPIVVLLFSSFISTALGALWWNTGIQQVGASTASLFQNATPIIGVLASGLFLGEQLNWHHFAALILVLLGVSLGTGVLQIPACLVFLKKQLHSFNN
jgi:drug/metabolite transporter (DMT)-like permease